MENNSVEVELAKVNTDTGKVEFLSKISLRRIPVPGEFVVWDGELWSVENVVHKTHGPLDEVIVVESTGSDASKLGR